MKQLIGWLARAGRKAGTVALLLAWAAPGYAQMQASPGGIGAAGGAGGQGRAATGIGASGQGGAANGSGAGGQGGAANGSAGGLSSGMNLSAPPQLSAGLLGIQADISAGAAGGPAASGGRMSVSSGVSPANIFFATFNNPMAGGYTSGGQFGSPLFGNLTQGVNTGTGTVRVSIVGSALGSAGGIGFGTGVSLGPNTGYGPVPVKATDFSAPANLAGPLQAELRRILARSTALSSGPRIEVLVAGESVMLRGKVADERERRLAEGLVWLTPGVAEVRNELSLR